MFSDLRFSLRALRKSPGFVIVAVLTIALGIGANTAMFSVVYGVLLKPLPYRDPDRIVRLQEGRPGYILNISYPNFLDWRARNRVFDDMVIYNPAWASTLTVNGQAEVVQSGATEAKLFDFLGMPPVIGRTFAPGEDDVVILSHRLWQTRFGGDPSVVGRALKISGGSATVIGILPPEMLLDGKDLWFPLLPEQMHPVQMERGNHPGFRALARLKREVTLDQARRAMSGIAKDLERQYPSTNFNMGVFVIPILESAVGQVRPIVWMLFGAVGFVLLIACANVANVLMARAVGRGSEVAVRAALGAGRGRLLRLFLTESLLLGAVGGTAGVLLAGWMVDALKLLGPSVLPRAAGIGLDSAVLVYTGGITLITAMLFGFAPAWQASRVNLLDALKQGGRSSPTGGRGLRLRWGLISTEVALSVVLLVGAGLMLRTLASLAHVDPGYRPEGLLAFNLRQSGERYAKSEAIDSFNENLLARIRALPGVQSAATAWPFDLISFGLTPSARFSDKAVTPGREPSVETAFVSPDYFDTMRIPTRSGRGFTTGDRQGAPTVAVVSEKFAQTYYPRENPLGKRLTLVGYDFLKSIEVVGVAGNTLRAGLAGATNPELYLPYAQMPTTGNSMVVRTAGDPMQLVNAVRAEIARLDSEVATDSFVRVEDALQNTVSNRRFTRSLLLAFALLALALAAVGIYGVVAYSIGQRTQEIGVRMALGAQKYDVIRLVAAQTVAPVGIGLAIGIASAAILTRYLESQLYGVRAFDPMTVAWVVAMLGLVALGACWVPAWRAAKLDPLAALRVG